MTDSHIHLTDTRFDNILGKVLSEFHAVGGHALLNVGYDNMSNMQVISQRNANTSKVDMYTAIGLHPELFQPNNGQNAQYTSYAKATKALKHFSRYVDDNSAYISAIGETGLDYYQLYKNCTDNQQIELSKELQKLAFRTHVSLALRHAKPMTIHIRESTAENTCTETALKILLENGMGQIHGSFHSYTGPKNFIQDIINMGLFIGVNGIITYKSADNVRAIVEATPLDNILLETDAPYLKPRTKKSSSTKSFCTPADAIHTAEKIAEIKKESVQTILDVTENNFYKLFDD
jgi:TatD DNase family protein